MSTDSQACSGWLPDCTIRHTRGKSRASPPALPPRPSSRGWPGLPRQRHFQLHVPLGMASSLFQNSPAHLLLLPPQFRKRLVFDQASSRAFSLTQLPTQMSHTSRSSETRLRNGEVKSPQQPLFLPPRLRDTRPANLYPKRLRLPQERKWPGAPALWDASAVHTCGLSPQPVAYRQNHPREWTRRSQMLQIAALLSVSCQ